MTLLAAVLMLIFVIGVIKYAIQLRKIRTYIKVSDPALFKSHSLDAVSLLLGTDDVDWNFQVFIFKKQYSQVGNAEFVCMCNKAHKWGLVAYSAGSGVLLTMLAANVIGN